MTKTRKTVLLATLGIIFILALVVVTVNPKAFAAEEELTGYYFKVDGQVVNNNTIQLRRGQTSGVITYWHDGEQQSATFMIMPQTIASTYLTLNGYRVTASVNTPISYTEADTPYIMCLSNGLMDYLYIQILPANVISIVNTGTGAFTFTASGIDIQNIDGSLETVRLAVRITNAVGEILTKNVTVSNNGLNLINTYPATLSGYYLSGHNPVELVSVTYIHDGKSITYDVDSYTPILFGTTTSYVYTYFEGGNGSAADPYTIKYATQLDNIRNVGLSNHFKLISDITMSTYGDYVPIPGSFQGTFDGNGKKIINLTMLSLDDVVYYGLFERIGASGIVKNLSFENEFINVAEANSSVYIGVIAGYNSGSISNCTLYTGTINSVIENSNIGGIVGCNYGTITKCKNYVNVSGCGAIGGIAGRSGTGSVTDCSNYGAIKLELQKINGVYYTGYAGGIVGHNLSSAAIEGCANYGSIIYSGKKTISSQIRPCMAKIVGWLQSGSQTGNVCSGSVNYDNLYSTQKGSCKTGAVGKQGI